MPDARTLTTLRARIDAAHLAGVSDHAVRVGGQRVTLTSSAPAIAKAERAAHLAGVSDNAVRAGEFSAGLLMHYSPPLLSKDFTMMMRRGLAVARLAGRRFTWPDFKSVIRNKLSDPTGREMVESFVSMRREGKQDLQQWVRTLIVARDLCVQKGQHLSNDVCYSYFYDQMTSKEKALAIPLPKTEEERAA